MFLLLLLCLAFWQFSVLFCFAGYFYTFFDKQKNVSRRQSRLPHMKYLPLTQAERTQQKKKEEVNLKVLPMSMCHAPRLSSDPNAHWKLYRLLSFNFPGTFPLTNRIILPIYIHRYIFAFAPYIKGYSIYKRGLSKDVHF